MGRLNASRRTGFTLIEMLVVIFIIILLVGLLLPAIQKARDAAMRARVKSEIAGIGTGIENVKSTYDVKYIPTFWILTNNYNPQAGDSNATIAALIESREFYSKVWPKAFLPYPNPAPGPGFTPLANDVNRIHLDGNQLLVFLLGGVPPAGSNFPGSFQGSRSGFVNSPTNPFGFNGSTENSPGTNQNKGPFFDFDPKRVDANGHFHDPYWKVSAVPDSLSVYYYFSSKFGNDYDYWGIKYVAEFNPSNQVGGPTLDGGYGFMNPHVGIDGKYVEPNGYQIVSAGKDQVPGYGCQSMNPGVTTRPFNPAYVWPGSGSYKVSRSGMPAPYDPNGGGADDISNWSSYALGSDK